MFPDPFSIFYLRDCCCEAPSRTPKPTFWSLYLLFFHFETYVTCPNSETSLGEAFQGFGKWSWSTKAVSWVGSLLIGLGSATGQEHKHSGGFKSLSFSFFWIPPYLMTISSHQIWREAQAGLFLASLHQSWSPSFFLYPLNFESYFGRHSVVSPPITHTHALMAFTVSIKGNRIKNT